MQNNCTCQQTSTTSVFRFGISSIPTCKATYTEVRESSVFGLQRYCANTPRKASQNLRLCSQHWREYCQDHGNWDEDLNVCANQRADDLGLNYRDRTNITSLNIGGILGLDDGHIMNFRLWNIATLPTIDPNNNNKRKRQDPEVEPLDAIEKSIEELLTKAASLQRRRTAKQYEELITRLIGDNYVVTIIPK